MPKTTIDAINPFFQQIAQQYLRVETLEIRNMDSLDFPEVSVRGLQLALQAAFEAGAQSAKPVL